MELQLWNLERSSLCITKSLALAAVKTFLYVGVHFTACRQ